MEHDAIIIGAGAAGLWAAGTAAARGRRVLLLEKNSKFGVKILMSGGTRCNVTHHCDERGIADAFGRSGKALLGPLSRMNPRQVVDIFSDLGVETKVEETGKVFPVSNRAIDVRDALLRRITEHGGEVLNNTPVLDIEKTDSGFAVVTDNQRFTTPKILITTGGLSFSGCGTTGDGYPWVKKFGHTVSSLRPALTPLVSSANWVHQLSGLTLDDVTLQSRSTVSLKKDAKLERSRSRGGFLWTHFGCSGPTAMNVSRCFSGLDRYHETFIEIDLLPDTPAADCHDWLGNGGSRTVANLLGSQLPKRIAATVLELAGVDGATRQAELSKKATAALVTNIKSLAVPVHGTRGYPKAEVTAGGVLLNEVNFQTMESRLQPGLYLAGEILDLDGPIGGYNFQAAWSTGHVAGESL
jgi:hypothetical protein